jgi:hypothetical protein
MPFNKKYQHISKTMKRRLKESPFYVTDGITWNNATYYYSTEATVSGHNLRYDVSNDGTINVLDLSADWASNTIIGGEYNGFYDVNTDTEVNVLDLSKIWSDNSVGG